MIKKNSIVTLFLLLTLSGLALKPQKEYIIRPEYLSLIYKELTTKTEDGLNIKIWFIPAQDSVSQDIQRANYLNPIKREYNILDSIPRPTIIICDGDAGNMCYNIYAAEKYALKGYNVALFDWRGFGESDDFEINTDYLFYSEFLLDYEAVINTINKLPETKQDHIGLFGFSTGAYFSFAAAYQNPKIKCFIGRALMTSFDEFLPLLYSLYPEKDGRLIVPNNYPRKLCPINIADNFKKPTMLIVGTEDKKTPIEMSKRILDQLQADKELWIVDGAGHGGAEAPEVKEFSLFYHKTLSFFDAYLK